MNSSSLKSETSLSSIAEFDHTQECAEQNRHEAEGPDETHPTKRRAGRGRLVSVDRPQNYSKTAETDPESSVSSDQVLTEISLSSANSDRSQAILNGHAQATDLLDHVREFQQELSAIAAENGYPWPYKNGRSLGQRLAHITAGLSEGFRIETYRDTANYFRYRFWPMAETLIQCESPLPVNQSANPCPFNGLH